MVVLFKAFFEWPSCFTHVKFVTVVTRYFVENSAFFDSRCLVFWVHKKIPDGVMGFVDGTDPVFLVKSLEFF